jgi:hypothetical protein
MAAPEDVRLLSQVNDDMSMGDEKENLYEPAQKKSPYNLKFFVASHVVLFGLYALGLYLVWNRDPSTKACAKRLSTHCKKLRRFGDMPF